MKCNWIFLNTSWGLEPKEKHVLIVEGKRGKSVEVILGCEVLQELFWCHWFSLMLFYSDTSIATYL